MKFNKKTAAVIIFFAFLVQLIIITYNYLNGFIYINNISNFLIRIITGTFFSSIFGIIAVYLDLKIITLLEKKYLWEKNIILRLILESFAAVFIGILIGVTVTITSHIFFPFEDLVFNIINNSLISIVINIILVIILEAIFYFKRNKETTTKAEKLERENAEIKLETLKNQLNPHFLFNSLNVLSALVRKDKNLAEKFIDEFSSVYRYILDVIDKPVIELKEEINFAKSYLYLQSIRFDNALISEININAEKLNNFVPPLSVQTLLENALKHNKATVENPLTVKIFNDGDYLFITNNLQPKIKSYDSKGIGLNNLTKRYKFISGIEPEFRITDKEYVAKIPLINSN